MQAFRTESRILRTFFNSIENKFSIEVGIKDFQTFLNTFSIDKLADEMAANEELPNELQFIDETNVYDMETKIDKIFLRPDLLLLLSYTEHPDKDSQLWSRVEKVFKKWNQMKARLLNYWPIIFFDREDIVIDGANAVAIVSEYAKIKRIKGIELFLAHSIASTGQLWPYLEKDREEWKTALLISTQSNGFSLSENHINGIEIANQWIISSVWTEDYIFNTSSLIGNAINNNFRTLAIDYMKNSTSVEHIDWLSSFVDKKIFYQNTTETELMAIIEGVLKERRMYFSVIEKLVNVFFDKCKLFGIGTDSQDIASLNHFFNSKWEIALSVSVISVNDNTIRALYSVMPLLPLMTISSKAKYQPFFVFLVRAKSVAFQRKIWRVLWQRKNIKYLSFDYDLCQFDDFMFKLSQMYDNASLYIKALQKALNANLTIS